VLHDAATASLLLLTPIRSASFTASPWLADNFKAGLARLAKSRAYALGLALSKDSILLVTSLADIRHSLVSPNYKHAVDDSELLDIRRPAISHGTTPSLSWHCFRDGPLKRRTVTTAGRDAPICMLAVPRRNAAGASSGIRRTRPLLPGSFDKT